MKSLAKTMAVAALSLSILAPTLALARPHKVCHYSKHHHHRVCRWVR